MTLVVVGQQGYLHLAGPQVHGMRRMCRLLALLAFQLCFWDNKKERLALPSMQPLVVLLIHKQSSKRAVLEQQSRQQGGGGGGAALTTEHEGRAGAKGAINEGEIELHGGRISVVFVHQG